MATTKAWPRVSISIVPATGKPQLVWERVFGAEKYEVYRAEREDGEYTRMWTVTDTHYTNTTAKPGKTYYYKVKAMTAKPEFSEVSYITCDCVRPSVRARSDEDSGQPVLTWTAVEGASKYEIHRATSRNGSFKHIWSTEKCTYRNTTAMAGVTYYYKVRALCAVSRFGDSALSEPCYITCDCAAPQVSLKGDVLEWKAVEGARDYEIYRAANEDGTFMRIATVNEECYLIPNRFEGGTYYKVKARNEKTSYGDSALSAAIKVCGE